MATMMAARAATARPEGAERVVGALPAWGGRAGAGRSGKEGRARGGVVDAAGASADSAGIGGTVTARRCSFTAPTTAALGASDAAGAAPGPPPFANPPASPRWAGRSGEVGAEDARATRVAASSTVGVAGIVTGRGISASGPAAGGWLPTHVLAPGVARASSIASTIS